MLKLYDPSDWYWLDEEGRIYSSASQSLVNADDETLLAWKDAGGVPTIWPRDENGDQTDEALSAVLSPYGINLWPLSLDEIKDQLKVQIDADAERERLKYITAGAGQAMTYQQKTAEARALLDDVSPSPEDYPLLAVEVGITAASLTDVANTVLGAFQQWQVIGAAIEAARLGTKMAISEAETAVDAQAAFAAVVWPTP